MTISTIRASGIKDSFFKSMVDRRRMVASRKENLEAILIVIGYVCMLDGTIGWAKDKC